LYEVYACWYTWGPTLSFKNQYHLRQERKFNLFMRKKSFKIYRSLSQTLVLFLTQKEGIKTEKESRKGADNLVPPPTFLPQPLESNKDVI
jgi:hypothetical protein